MRILREILRWIFALEALACIVFAASIIRILLSGEAHLHRHYFWTSVFVQLLFLCLPVTYAFVAGSLAIWIRSSSPYLRWTGRIASGLHLLAIIQAPFLGLAGIAGLIVFIRKPIAEQPRTKHQPVSGDGTNKWTQWLWQGVGIAVLILLLNRTHHWMADAGLRPLKTGFGSFELLFALAILASVSIHEAGHFLLGRSVQFSLRSLRVTVFSWAYREGRWHFKFEPSGLFGGAAGMVPLSVENLRERAMLFTAGGPIASLMLGIIGWISLALFGGPKCAPVLGEFLILITAFGLTDFISNLLPVGTETNYSDGARLWQYHRRGEWCDYLCSIHYVAVSRASALRPREWPTEMIERSAEFAKKLPAAAGISMFAYMRFEDAEDIEKAAYYLEQAAAHAKPKSRMAHVIALEQAYFEAFYRRNAETSAHHFQMGESVSEISEYWRSKAAVLAAKGDLQAASEAWKHGWTKVENLPPIGVYEFDRRQFQNIGQWIEASIAGEPAQSSAQAAGA